MIETGKKTIEKNPKEPQRKTRMSNFPEQGDRESERFRNITD
jgi:hypothetical protein